MTADLPRTTPAHPARPRPVLRCLAAAALLLAAWPAQALFKIVNPDGSVTYSDRPPPSPQGRAQALNPGAGAAAEPALPLALRDAAQRYPVTLYVGNECAACEQARGYLRERGVPHAERLVSTRAEAELMGRTLGGTEVPSVTIGTQAIRGYSAGEWGEYLDAAGYPRSSVLPRSYRHAAATPLIPPPRVAGGAAAPASAPEAAPEAPPPAAPASTPENPTGIRF
jgi:glutaredoxin